MRRRKQSGDIPRQGVFTQVHKGVGDNIFNLQVRVSSRRYLLEAFSAPKPVRIQGGPPSRLLAADMEVVPFDHRRDPDLSRLEKWRDRPATLQVMLVSGPGGQGKTRLVGEFARRCGAADWIVAQARHTGDLKPGAVPAGPGSSGRLLMVDYAERWPVDDLRDLFTDPFVTQETATRVLLVARPAGRWWESLRGRLSDLVPDPDHLRLGALASGPMDRRTAFERARNAFAARLGVSEPERIEPPASLDHPAFDLVLSLHMAALVAVDAHVRGQPVPDDPAELTSYLVRREYLYWERMRENRRIEATALQMAGATFTATLTRPMSWTAAEEVLAAARVADSADLARSVLSAHQACYPAQEAGAGAVLEPLYPDRLGEDFVAVHLTGGPGHELDLADGSFDRIPACLLHETVDGRYPGHARHVITTLVETARRWPHVANGYLYPLLRDRPGVAFAAGGATLAALAERADITLLESLEPHLPADRHVDLDLAAAVITRRLTEHRLATESDPVRRARLNALLAWRLFDADLYAEALAASVPTVQAYRELADANPTTFTPGLARALYNLSVLLSALNSNEALAFGWEAVYTYRCLADADPAGFEAEFAGTLYFMSILLPDLGRREDALSVAEYAVQVYQRLAVDGGAGLKPDLARALGSMSRLLSGLERREEALAAAHDAVQVYRALVKTQPGEFDEDLARAWRDVAGILGELGRGKEALSAADQAVSLYRGLCEVNPGTFGLGLGEALREQSALLWAVGRKEDAAAVMEEAVDALHQAAASPFSHQLISRAHSTLAAILAELGRREEALAAKERAADIDILHDPFVYRRDLAPDDALALAGQVVQSYRGLAAANPAAFLRYVPQALRDLSDILAGLGRREDALAATRDALKVHSQLATDDPAGSAPDLAKTLEQWVALRRLGGQEEALAAAEQAVQAYRRLVEHSAETFTPYLPQALRDLSDVLLELGRPEEAVTARQEAVQIYRNLPDDSPAEFVGGLIPTSKEGELLQTSNDLAAMLSRMGRWEEALAAKQEAVQIYRSRNAGNPQFTPTLMQALNDLVGILSELGRCQEAAAVSQAAKREAVQIYREAAAANPAVFTLDLASALSDLARFLSDQGRPEEAVAPAQETVQVYRGLAAANPTAFGRDLADRLRVLSAVLSKLGRQEDALAAVREAVQAYQRLALAYPAVFAPHLAEMLGNLSTSPAKTRRREDPFAVSERIFWDSVPLARQNGLTFIVALQDTDDAAGFARLLADVRQSQPETATVFLASPVCGSKFFAQDTCPASWYEENVPPSSAVVYILDHEPGLSQRLQGIPGTFYVGVPELATGEEYGDSVRIVVTASVLDFATVIMRDYSGPSSLHGIIFDEAEALKMRNLAADFPADLMDPAAWGNDSVPSGPFSFDLTRESQQRARSAYRSPERSVLLGTE